MMKTLLICHDGAKLDEEGLANWLAAFSDLVGVIVIRENRQRLIQRIRREIKRVGIVRFADVIAFRSYYKIVLSRRDQAWEDRRLQELRSIYPSAPEGTPVLLTHSPNSPDTEEFVKRLAPDIMLARCKTLLKENFFTIPSIGTFVMHPGVCPEYRNAHGCFWALANRDLEKVGMTLLKIDKGVDTGPVYGYYSYPFDEVHESHMMIQHEVVLHNLDELQKKLEEIYAGMAVPLDTRNRQSGEWGQPWMTKYISWKLSARRRRQ